VLDQWKVEIYGREVDGRGRRCCTPPPRPSVEKRTRERSTRNALPVGHERCDRMQRQGDEDDLVQDGRPGTSHCERDVFGWLLMALLITLRILDDFSTGRTIAKVVMALNSFLSDSWDPWWFLPSYWRHLRLRCFANLFRKTRRARQGSVGTRQEYDRLALVEQIGSPTAAGKSTPYNSILDYLNTY
jgi:hypothetical protein